MTREGDAAKARRTVIWKRVQSDHSVTLHSEESGEGVRYILEVWTPNDDATTSTETAWVPK